uniref:Fibronectin type-III domain-containing protein n=1 Tax=Astyanax mexicanus TaxID=7994 RepID=A0A8B9HI73_ASTMX
FIYEVVLDCSGHVSVDGVPVVMPAKWKDRFGGTQGDTDALRTSQKEVKNTDTSGTFNPTVRNSAATQTNQNTNTAGIYNKLQSAVADSTVKPPVITTEQQKRPSNDFTVGQVTQPQRVGGVSEEGGAFSITMEMGISSERGITAEYEDYEDYEDGDEGLRVTRAIKRQTRWTRSGQRIRSIKRGGALRIPALQLADSGNYSCYRDDRLVWSVNISVGGTTKTVCMIFLLPVFFTTYHSCYAKSLYLILYILLSAATCIKPDPPARVVVKPVEGQIHTLHVSWSNPSTWRDTDNFYHLHFHLRYRPVLARQFQEVRIEDGKHIWSVLDALPGTLYEVQLRAKDEYVGMWSEWTSPVYAHTWTGNCTSHTHTGSGSETDSNVGKCVKEVYIMSDTNSFITFICFFFVFVFHLSCELQFL